MNSMHPRTFATAVLVLALAASMPSRAQNAASEASFLSALPVAVSVVAPVMIFTAGATLTVVSVQASAMGAVWILERASDGARASLRLSGQMAGASLLATGTVITVVAMSTGWLLSAAGQVVAFVPNAVGAALLHNERVTK